MTRGRRSSTPRKSRTGARGFTYMTALILVATLGAGLATIGELWSRSMQRQKEEHLIWIGDQFIQAIGQYYQRSPGAVKRYPDNLEALLIDRRFLNTQRYLRMIYKDPMTGRANWKIIYSPSGGIMGIASTSSQVPIGALQNARTYSDRVFTYLPPETDTKKSSNKTSPLH